VEQDTEMGGEASCFLGELDASGAVPDPRNLIRLAHSGVVGAWTVFVGDEPPGGDAHDDWAPELAPLAGEELTAYRERLLQPLARTVAWRVALQTEERLVAVVPGPRVTREMAGELVAYLRSLIS